MIRVSAPARIHINAAEMNGNLGRAGVGFGFALKHPRTVVEIRDQQTIAFSGGEDPKIRQVIDTVEEHVGKRLACEVSVVESIPQHKGLGSGTQLILSVAVGLMNARELEYETVALASWNGRGQHSGIGLGLFQGGGFVVDAGFTIAAWKKGIVVPIMFRCRLPENWRVVLAIPCTTKDPGLDLHTGAWLPGHGPSSVKDCELISRELVTRLMPAALSGDLAEFGASINAISTLGHKENELKLHGMESIKSLLKTMREAGAVCAGLSSGGPTVYGVTADNELATHVAEAAKHHPRMKSGEVFVTSVDNHGTSIVKIEQGMER
jgi:beta-ribofuranosylaminobenzene 5'-phosphate synthase